MIELFPNFIIFRVDTTFLQTRKLEVQCMDWFSIALWLYVRVWPQTSVNAKNHKKFSTKSRTSKRNKSFLRHLSLNPVCVAILLLHMHNLLLPSSYWSEIRRPGVPLVDLWGWVTVLEKAITLAPSTNTMLQVPWTCFRKPTCVENRM